MARRFAAVLLGAHRLEGPQSWDLFGHDYRDRRRQEHLRAQDDLLHDRHRVATGPPCANRRSSDWALARAYRQQYRCDMRGRAIAVLGVVGLVAGSSPGWVTSTGTAAPTSGQTTAPAQPCPLSSAGSGSSSPRGASSRRHAVRRRARHHRRHRHHGHSIRHAARIVGAGHGGCPPPCSIRGGCLPPPCPPPCTGKVCPERPVPADCAPPPPCPPPCTAAPCPERPVPAYCAPPPRCPPTAMCAPPPCPPPCQPNRACPQYACYAGPTPGQSGSAPASGRP